VLIDVEVRAVGQVHDLADSGRKVTAVVRSRDALARTDELRVERLVVQCVGKAPSVAARDETGAPARDVHELADEIRVDLGREGFILP
jgi:hypothetical protein